MPRGELSEYVIGLLTSPTATRAVPSLRYTSDPLSDDDFGLALYVAYELHYRSFADVPDELEWDLRLISFRRILEAAFVGRLAEESAGAAATATDIESELLALVEGSGGPSLSSYMVERGTISQMREFAVHRSAYQLKEADPHTWAIPRLMGGAKAALIRIQADEYGDGAAQRMHQQLFATTMRALALDPTYGAYLDRLPGTTLATVNLITLFGLNRRWRGALVGNLRSTR